MCEQKFIYAMWKRNWYNCVDLESVPGPDLINLIKSQEEPIECLTRKFLVVVAYRSPSLLW